MTTNHLQHNADFLARKAAWKFYGKDVDRLNADIVAHNKGVIIVCHKCHKLAGQTVELPEWEQQPSEETK